MSNILTMDDKYGDGSDHQVCAACGLCIECGDCKKYGCGKELIEIKEIEWKRKTGRGTNVGYNC